MNMHFLVLFLVLSPLCVVSQTLIESGPGTVRPSETLKLICTVSGFELSSYGIHWVRQPPGKGLEWLGAIWTGGGTAIHDSLKNRISITKDNGKKQVYFAMTAMETKDTAVYYCARDGIADYFDYWGQGSLVTVTTASEKAPSLFPLISCGQSQNPVIIGCLAKDFLPESIDFSWSDKSNNSITSGFKNFKPVMKIESDDKYSSTASSQYSLSRAIWDTEDPFYCTAKHKVNSKTVKIVKRAIVTKPPTVSIHPPLKDNQDGNVSIVCLMSGFSPATIEVKWLMNGKDIKNYKMEGAVSDGDGTFSATSYIFVPKRDWDRDYEYTCAVTHPSSQFSEMKNISKSQVCEAQTTTPINVRTIPPTLEDLFESGRATLRCVVSNMSSTKDLSISWYKSGSPEEKLVTVIEDEIYENGAYSVTGTAEVCAEDWKTDTFLCKVKHPELASLKEVPLSKEKVYPTSPPAVYVFPPHQEELNLKETATLTCLAAGFTPKDVFIKWLWQGKPMDKTMYANTEPLVQSNANGKKMYSIYSKLNVDSKNWTDGSSYTCVVGHEALPLQLAQRSIDKSSGNPKSVNVSLVLSDTCS